jgi:protein Mpv17
MIDWDRARRLAFWGFCISGPFNCFWYYFLDKFVKFNYLFITIILRMSLDQLIVAPIFIALFIAYNSFYENKKFSSQMLISPSLIPWKSHIMAKLRNSYWEVLKANWKIWPAVQCLNFSIVPLQYRLLFVNIVSLGWNAYLSVAANKVDMSQHVPIKHVAV